MSTITIVRHGTVEINKSKKVSALDFGLWINEYNRATVKDDCDKKDEIFQLLDAAEFVVCSKLSRSIESVALFDKSPCVINKAFNEAPLPNTSWIRLKLAPAMWLIFFRMIWLLGYSKNTESYAAVKIRAKVAAKMLIDLSRDNNDVVLMGHGLMNRLIIKELVFYKYMKIENGGNKNWSYSVLRLK